MRVEFQKITKLSVQNSIFIGDLFLIEVSNGLLHPLGSRQRVKLYPARALPVTPAFRSLHAFRVHKDHLNKCTKQHCYWVLISYRGFRWVTPSLGCRQRIILFQLGCLRGHEFLGACMRLEFMKITAMSSQNSMFIGDLFFLEVSDELLHPL